MKEKIISQGTNSTYQQGHYQEKSMQLSHKVKRLNSATSMIFDAYTQVKVI